MTRWGRILTRTLLAVTAVSAPLLAVATPAFAADTLQARVDPNQGPFGTKFTVTVQEHLDGGQKCGGTVVLRQSVTGKAISEAADMPPECKTTITATTPQAWDGVPGAKAFVAVANLPNRPAVESLVSNRLTFFVTLTGTKSTPPAQSPTPTKAATPTATATATKTAKATTTTAGQPTVQDSPPDLTGLTGGAVDTGTGNGVALKRTGSSGSTLGWGIAGAALIVLGFVAVLFLLLRRRDDQPPADEQPAYPGGGPQDPTYGGGGYEGAYGGSGGYAPAGMSNAPTMGADGGYGSGQPGGYGYGGGQAGGLGQGGPVAGGFGAAGLPGPAGGYGNAGGGYGQGDDGSAATSSFGAAPSPAAGYGAGPGGNWQARSAEPTGTGSPITAPMAPWAGHDDATDVVSRLPDRPEPPTGR